MECLPLWGLLQSSSGLWWGRLLWLPLLPVLESLKPSRRFYLAVVMPEPAYPQGVGLPSNQGSVPEPVAVQGQSLPLFRLENMVLGLPCKVVQPVQNPARELAVAHPTVLPEFVLLIRLTFCHP